MKTFSILLISFFCLSFCPSTEKAVDNTSNGFYISVIDHTDRTYHSFIVESRDSANIIFNKYFESELDLGEVDYPITIFNGKRDFYIARVNVYVKSNGERDFKHLSYPDVFVKKSKSNKRNSLSPAIF